MVAPDIRIELQRATRQIRHHCPDCGGKTFFDTDVEWGSFGVACCEECDWEEATGCQPPSDAELAADTRDLAGLPDNSRFLLLTIEKLRHAFATDHLVDKATCLALADRGFVQAIRVDRDDYCFIRNPD